MRILLNNSITNIFFHACTYMYKRTTVKYYSDESIIARAKREFPVHGEPFRKKAINRLLMANCHLD